MSNTLNYTISEALERIQQDAAARIEALEARLQLIRMLLGGSDVASLPNDYTTEKMAVDRMTDLATYLDRIEALEAALHIAFMAMCAQRDNPDDEVFQDAIDALGMATSEQPR